MRVIYGGLWVWSRGYAGTTGDWEVVMAVRASELAAMAMIGDGVLGALMPERHVSRWILGSQKWRPMHFFSEHPALTRVLGIAEAAIGLWWAAALPATPD